MELLYLESFYGGSHRDVADNIAKRSRHHVELRTLPARFWKWRMRGAALSFAHELRDPDRFDLVVCGGMMSIADLRAQWHGGPPVLLYAHETQLSYPSPDEREADLHFAFTDLTNMLCADHVAFNSRTHRTAYLEALPGFLRRLPEYRPAWARAQIDATSSVCYPGIDADPNTPIRRRNRSDDGPLIVWNHRWEFDKAPEGFFNALRELKRRGIRFRVALLGERFQAVPAAFEEARDEFADQIVHYGYVRARAEYLGWLERADIVVSTSIQENFGISVMEAVACGARPLLPRRLSYPELFGLEDDAFYDGDLADRLASLVERAGRESIAPSDELVAHARGFAWERRIGEFDALFERVAAER